MQARRCARGWKNETADSPKLKPRMTRNYASSRTPRWQRSCSDRSSELRDGARGVPSERRVPLSAVKIGASRQVIIPKKVYEELGLAAGDYLDVRVQDGSLLMSPKTLVDKPIHNHRERNDDA